MSFGKLSIRGRALQYLARREHSRLELQTKLRRYVDDTPEAPAAEQIARALDELTAHGLLSEERVAESVLRTQAARFGSRRLQQTLQAKGLDAELIASTLRQARLTDHERAMALWERRFGEPGADAAARAAQMRFLAARGFDADVIRKVVRGRVEDD